MENKDIRWKQRFENLQLAFEQLNSFNKVEQLNDLEKQGVIKAFEYTFELSWKMLQDYLQFLGFTDFIGPRLVIEQAFALGLINDGHEWLSMLKSRNLTSHTYNSQTADEILKAIKSNYISAFEQLITHFNSIKTR